MTSAVLSRSRFLLKFWLRAAKAITRSDFEHALREHLRLVWEGNDARDEC